MEGHTLVGVENEPVQLALVGGRGEYVAGIVAALDDHGRRAAVARFEQPDLLTQEVVCGLDAILWALRPEDWVRVRASVEDTPVVLIAAEPVRGEGPFEHVVCPGEWTRLAGLLTARAAARQVEAVPTDLRDTLLAALLANPAELVVAVDMSGGVQFVNQASQAILGRPPAELIGAPLEPWVHPDDRHLLMAPADPEGAVKELRLQHRDGSWVPLECRCAPFGGTNGGLRVVRARDVTRRRAARQNTALLVSAIEQVGEGIVITGNDGTIQYVNPAFERITGYPRDEAVGRNPRILKSGHEGPELFSQMWQTIAHGEQWQGRLTNRRRDGSHYREEMTISPVRDAAGQISNFISVKRDVTELETLESQLVQAQKMEAVGRLAGGVAHDFNNLLTLLIGHAEFIQMAVPEDNPIRADVDGILAAAKRATGLTRQLLTLSRQEPTQPELVDVNVVVRQVEALLRRTVEEDIELVCRLAADIPPVEIDPSKLEQVVTNLALNARDAMPTGGRLGITTGQTTVGEEATAALPPGRYVEVTVTDTGSGMSEDVLRRVFEPYFTTKPRGKGTGLGLSTAYGLVSQAAGLITCRSEPGHGSVFTVCLPAARRVEGPQGAGPLAAVEAARPAVILLAEDEDSVRLITRRILEHYGHRVHDATSGAGALALLDQLDEPVDLLLTDVVMPGMSGRELAEAFATRHPGIPVLFMSGYTAEIMADRGLMEGFDLLPKPFTAEQLIHRVQAAMRRGPDPAR